MITKRCTTCAQWKPLDQYDRKAKSADGHAYRCKSCRAEQQRRAYLASKERWAPARAAYRQRTRSEAAARARAWYAEHQAYARERERRRLQGPERERLLEAKRAEHARNRQRANAARKAHYRANWLAASISARNRYARGKGAVGVFTLEDVGRIRAAQQDRCAYCGTPLGERFHIDHVRPLVRGGSNLPGNLALACRRCNLRKHHMTGEEFRAMLAEEEGRPTWV